MTQDPRLGHSDPSSASPTQTPPAPAKPGRRSHTVMIAGGALLGAAALIGGGIAAGVAIANGAAGTRASHAGTAAPQVPGSSEESSAPRTGAAPTTGGSSTMPWGASSAEDLMQTITLAAQSPDDIPLGIEAHAPGEWVVTFAIGNGVETDVRVLADGSTVVLDRDVQDYDDRAAYGRLDEATVESLVRATLSMRDARIVDIDIDDDPYAPFDVKAVAETGEMFSLELTRDFRVVETELDD